MKLVVPYAATRPGTLGKPYETATSEEVLRLVNSTGALYWTTAHWSGLQFDPIFTPLFTSFFTSIGFSASTAALAGGLATAIVTTAITVGLQALLAPKPPKPEDGKAPLTQSVPNRQWVIGTTRVAGAYMLWDAVGSRLYAVQAIAGHPIQSVNRFYLHDDEVTLDGSKFVVGEEDGRYSGQLVQIDYRLGANPETAYGQIVSDLAPLGLWTAEHRGDGQASIAMIAETPEAKDFNTRFPFNIPRLSVEISGARVWDFRDPGQSPADAATWTFSKNPVLQLCWHWCFSEFGHRRDYRKAILPVLDMWIEEANVCDEQVATAEGILERRYECSGWDTTEREPKVATNAILASFDGWLCERGDGALLVTAGKFRESRVATLTDDDICGHRVLYDVLFEEEINRLVPKFNYPDVDYSTSDTDFFEDESRQIIAGRVLAEDANYQWVTNWRQARRLGWREWQRIVQKIRGQLNVRLSGINSVYARWVRVNAPRRLPKLNGSLIENRRSVIDLTRGFSTMEFVRHPENIDQWSPAMEGAKPPVPSKATTPSVIPVPVINSVIAEASSGSVYLRVRVQQAPAGAFTLMVRYRVTTGTGGGGLITGDWVTKAIASVGQDGAFITASTDVVPADQQLEVQVAFMASNGKIGEWSAIETVTSTSDPFAPGVVIPDPVSSGGGTVLFSWTAPNSPNYAGARIYWNSVNDFASATFLGPVEYGSANASDTATRTMTPGLRYGWITSVNRSGVESAPASTGAFIV